MCNWEVSSWRKHLSVNSPNNPTRGRAIKGDLGIDDKCKRGIGVRGRAEEPARGLKRRSTRKGAGTQVGFCEDAVRKQSVSFPAAAAKGSLGSHLNEKLKLCIVPALLLPCLGRPAAQLEMHISYCTAAALLLHFSLVHSSSFQIQRPGQDGRLCDGVRWRREG